MVAGSSLTLFHTLDARNALAYEALVERIGAGDSVFDADEITIPPQENYKNLKVRVR